MMVKVRTFGNLRRLLPDCHQGGPLELPPGDTVLSLLAVLGISESDAWRVSRNGSLVALNQELYDGDEVSVFAPVGGGYGA